MRNLLQGPEQLKSIVLGFLQKDARHRHTGMNILRVDLGMMICQEVHLALRQGEVMLMTVMGKGLKGLLQVTMKDEPVIMIMFLGLNVHTLLWLVNICIKLFVIVLLFLWMAKWSDPMGFRQDPDGVGFFRTGVGLGLCKINPFDPPCHEYKFVTLSNTL